MNDSNMPLVSVVIPTYNRIHTLPASISSVLNQTYDHLELIVVDDGSDDGTEDYVRSIPDGRVKYIKSSTNKGPSAARNLGAKQAAGEYLAFHDSDDEWLPEKLKKQMALLEREKVSMVYCEFAVYYKGKIRALVPPREIPYEQKSGELFSYLLLYPLIGAPAIVVKKRDFTEAGGFNETLKAYEDYEFTLRFARQHRIGFVEEPLVRVNASLGSVNRQYDERIRVQFYMVREMYGPLKELGLLWAKLSAIGKEAERRKCRKVFLEEMERLSDLFVTGEERHRAALLSSKMEQRDESANQYRISAYEKLPALKQQVATGYLNLSEDKPEGTEELLRELRQQLDGLESYGELFRIPPKVQECCREAGRSLMTKPEGKEAWALLLAGIFRALEMLEQTVGQQLYECNVCGSGVFPKPVLEDQSGMGECPICGASEKDRLLIAFLEKLQPEGKEKLKMLLTAPWEVAERYALGRRDIRLETAELAGQDTVFETALQNIRKMDDETYDIIVCSRVLEQEEGSSEAWKELYRILKPDGICVAASPAAGEETTGFCVNALGEEWFGREFYQKHGLGEDSVLYAATKGIRL